MQPECTMHSEHDFRIANLENKVDLHEERISKHSGKAEAAILKAEALVEKGDRLMKQVDQLIAKSIEHETKLSSHLEESGFWRGFIVTTSVMLVIQLCGFIYMWGGITKQVEQNQSDIKDMREKHEISGNSYTNTNNRFNAYSN